MIVIGLTGSIGMGKTTTAGMFADAGIPVHDSDQAVHRIYEGPDAALIENEFPGTLVDGRIDRGRLGERILGDREAMKRLEAIVHPLVRRDADAFVARHRAAGAPAVVLDIPLLFETGGTDRVDRIVVVSAPADIQRERVLARPGMTPEKFEAILARQVPDAEKRRRADHVIDTGQGLEPARRAVEAIVEEIRREAGDRA